MNPVSGKTAPSSQPLAKSSNIQPTMPSTRRKKYLVAVAVILACLVLWWFLSGPKHDVRYKVTDLGAGLFTRHFVHLGINNQGQILINMVRPSGDEESFIRQPDGTEERFPNGGVRPVALNDRGDILGEDYRWGPWRTVILSATGSITEVTKMTRTAGRPTFRSLNNDRCAVGLSGIIWTATSGCQTVTGLRGTGFPKFFGVNDKGYIVGYHHASNECPIIRSPTGEIGELDRLGWGPATAYGVNNNNQVVGQSDIRGFIYPVLEIMENVRKELGVGTRNGHIEPNLHAVLWDDGILYDLNDLIPADSVRTLRIANDINDAGQIVGQGESGGVEHAFLLTPIEDKTKANDH